MSWFNVWDGLKKKTCRYLLQRYLGQFLEEKLNLEQLNIELYNGKATVKNVSLKVDALNELFEAQGWPVEVTGGKIGLITVTVPWNALMTSDSSIEISDLVICLRPVQRQNNGTSMFESMWSSVSSSLQLAQECMKQKDDDADAQQEVQSNSIDGLEKFAETIDNVLNRIKAKCTNVVLRLEYVSETSMQGLAIVININCFNYQNDAEHEKLSKQKENNSSLNHSKDDRCFDKNINILSIYATHNISINGLSICTEEFILTRTQGETMENENLSKDNFYIKTLECQKMNEKLSSQIDSDTHKIKHACEITPIPILKIKGQQKISIKMKQSEEVNGPKVLLDIELGPLCLILTPRQIHLICHFYDFFFDDEHLTKIPTKERQKMGEECSYLKADDETSYMTGILSSQNVWSEEDLATPYQQKNVIENEKSFGESVNSSMSSSSTMTNATTFQRKSANMDICTDISKFNIKVATIVAIILHEDILVADSSNELNESSQLNMLKIAKQYFLMLNTEFSTDNLDIKKILCNKNHLRVQLSSILLDGGQQRHKNVLVSKLSNTVTSVDIHEILEGKILPIIEFDRITKHSKGYNKSPEIIIFSKTTTHFFSKSHAHFNNTPKTEINIELERCKFELDISIYDRIGAVIGISPFTCIFKKNEIKKSPTSNSLREIKLRTTKFEVKLRFPIVDLRPIHDPQRCPWWKQNIRTDFLLISFDQFSITVGLNSLQVIANEINTFYCENHEDTKMHLLKICTTTKPTFDAKMEFEPEYPSITIEANNILNYDSKTRTNEGSSSVLCSKLPFSAKRVCRQSDTVHISGESETVFLPGDIFEMKQFYESTLETSKFNTKMSFPVFILHLKSKQLYEIIYNRINYDLLMWEPSSPIFRSRLKQKTRKNSFTFFDSESDFSKESFLNFMFSSSSESINVEESENDIEDNSSDNQTESVYISSHEDIINDEFDDQKIKLRTQSDSSLEISIGKGELTLLFPSRDKDNRVIPGQLGQFTLKFSSLNTFLVNGHNNNNNLSYLCLHLNDLEIYHCGLIPLDYDISIKNIDSILPIYMQSTFYKTPPELTKGKAVGCKTRELLSIVLEIKKLPEQNIKRLKITTGIQNITLRHNPSHSAQSWLNQLLDFLDIVDYPVAGYQPFGIITEMQLHLWDCAIDYRPKNLPYRSVVEIGSFNLSSNIISSITGCTLRFVAEDCVLSLAPFDNVGISYPQNKITNLPSIELVPLLEIGLLDISLRLSDKCTEKCPKFDLRTSIQDVHLRTCSDSGSALAQLIAYLANDGDIQKNVEDDDVNTTSSVLSSMYTDAELLEVNDRNPSARDISDMQQERVNKLMADALNETVTSEATSKDITSKSKGQGIEVYYFPDESKQASTTPDFQIPVSKPVSQLSENEELNEILNFEDNVMLNSYFVTKDPVLETLPQIKQDLGDISINDLPNERSMSQEDDYCLIAAEEKSYMSNYGIKDVKLSEDPIRIVDNHFYLPIAKPDLLQSPKNFPMAMQRYTLCEMTFTWHIYGGNDFPSTGTNIHKSNREECRNQKQYMSDAYIHGVSYSKSTQGIQYGKKPKENLTWKTIGGYNRNHEILVEIQLSKVRFSHEVYPIHTTHASRQVLLINDIEIRDRLQSSDINKFLYHPNSKNLSNRSNQNMLILKALHVRPNPEINSTQECSLRISLLPLRLHIDQDTLLFLVQFFTSIGDSYNDESVQLSNYTFGIHPIRDKHAPVMMVDDIPEAVQDLHARRLVSTNLELLMDNEKLNQSLFPESELSKSIKEDSSPTYFREIVFSPEVLIRLDYHGRRVELSRGPIAGLLMGLGQLQCSEIRLRKITYKRGLLGVDKLITYLCKEWLKDIKKNQLPNILSGVGPTYAFVQLFQGIYDLFWLPIEQFQKDGRLVRGLQLGAQSFTARTALAALEITSRIIQLLQLTAETAFDMVSPGPSFRRPRNRRKEKRKRPQRPKDIREGVTNAYLIVKEGFNNSAHTLIETTVAEHDQKGYTGAVGAVVRQIPQLVVCPAVLATQATTNILGGVKSSLVPEAKLEAREKWKDDTH